MNEAQEQILVNAIEGISWDIRRLTDKLAPASTVASHRANRYSIYSLHAHQDRYYCECRFGEFRHTLEGFECHRCLKFHSMDDFRILQTTKDFI